MDFVLTAVHDGVATVTLRRGKVNAINEAMTEELLGCLAGLSDDPQVKAVVLTGHGGFFSFGLDIPEFLTYPREDFLRFVEKFADLYTTTFLLKKPVIAALNGHTIAGGCMLATACDYRIMASGKARISLNEITFGSSLFPGSAELLKYCTGQRNAELIAYTGAMYSAEAAQSLGLIDQVVTEADFSDATTRMAREFAQRYGPAFASIKMLLRTDTGEQMRLKDRTFAGDIVDIWYSKETWKQLEKIKILS